MRPINTNDTPKSGNTHKIYPVMFTFVDGRKESGYEVTVPNKAYSEIQLARLIINSWNSHHKNAQQLLGVKIFWNARETSILSRNIKFSKRK